MVYYSQSTLHNKFWCKFFSIPCSENWINSRAVCLDIWKDRWGFTNLFEHLHRLKVSYFHSCNQKIINSENNYFQSLHRNNMRDFLQIYFIATYIHCHIFTHCSTLSVLVQINLKPGSVFSIKALSTQNGTKTIGWQENMSLFTRENLRFQIYPD